jgi:hypothetical protein
MQSILYLTDVVVGLPPKRPKMDKKQQALKRKSTWPKRNVTQLILYNGTGEKSFKAVAKARFLTGLDEFDRNSLWNLLGMLVLVLEFSHNG